MLACNKTIYVTVTEVKHEGHLHKAVRGLRAAGATEVKYVETNFPAHYAELIVIVSLGKYGALRQWIDDQEWS